MCISVSDWEWFGSPGHFICGRWCRFHLCTLVGEFLVSTVGAYVHPRHGQGSELKEQEWLKENWPGEDIGSDRKYETMVFKAGSRCVVEDCMCGVPGIDGTMILSKGCNTAGEATENHYYLCKEVASVGWINKT